MLIYYRNVPFYFFAASKLFIQSLLIVTFIESVHIKSTFYLSWIKLLSWFYKCQYWLVIIYANIWKYENKRNGKITSLIYFINHHSLFFDFLCPQDVSFYFF